MEASGLLMGRGLCGRSRVPRDTEKEVWHLELQGDSVVSSKEICWALKGVQVYCCQMPTSGDFMGQGSQHRAQLQQSGVPGEEGTVGDLWNYRSGQASPYIWRDISRSLNLGIAWVHDDLSSPEQEVAYLGPGAPALGSSWSGWTRAPWRPEPQRTSQSWYERPVPHCACATRRVGARTCRAGQVGLGFLPKDQELLGSMILLRGVRKERALVN